MMPPETNAPLLRISALTKRFGGFTALDNVSVDIRPGERFGLIGPNGSGKTTLINCISGAFRTEAGTVMFRDEDITGLQPHIRTRRGVARVSACAGPHQCDRGYYRKAYDPEGERERRDLVTFERRDFSGVVGIRCQHSLRSENQQGRL